MGSYDQRNFPNPYNSCHKSEVEDNWYEPTFAASSARFEHGECGYTKQSQEHFKNREIERNKSFEKYWEKNKNNILSRFLLEV